MNQILGIDPEFEAKCPPLTEEEFQQLEDNILEEGLVLMPLITWNNTIIDGHNRYKIAMAHPGIEFRTHEKVFDNRYEAISWICKNQLGRRNLSEKQRRYLIGQRYDAEKIALSLRGNQYTSTDKSACDKTCHKQTDTRTRKRIAEEVGISEGSVQNAFYYAKGVDAAEEVLPGVKEDLLSETIKPKDSDVVAIARASPHKRREMAENLRIAPSKKGKNGSKSEDAPKAPSKRRNQDYEDIDKIYEELKTPKKVTEKSALESLRYTAQNMISTCDVLFQHFPGLLSNQEFREQVIEIMQEPKQYIIKLEGEKEL